MTNHDISSNSLNYDVFFIYSLDSLLQIRKMTNFRPQKNTL
jgi:hypothetical protein